MMKKYIFILLFNLPYFVGVAQDLSLDFGAGPGNNFIEVHFYDVSIKNEGGESYLYFSIKLRALGDWYHTADGSHKECTNKEYWLSTLNLRFNYNADVFGRADDPVVNDMIEVNYDINDAGYDDPWDECFTMKRLALMVFKDSEIATINYSGGSRASTLARDELAPFATFKWKIKSGVTSGTTGMSLIFPEPSDYTITGNFPSLGTLSTSNSGLGFIVSGESLDIPISDTPAEKPVLAEVTGPTAICQGVEGGSYTTSFAAGADGATVKWAVKREGVDVTADVVKGGAITSTTTSATFTWSEDVPAGNYVISAIPTNAAGDGEEKLLPVQVFVPAVTIAGNASGCAGEILELTANPTDMQSYRWFVKNGSDYTLIPGAANAVYSPTLPTSGASVTYKVEAVAITAQGGCTASDEKTITINPVPPLTIETEIAGGKRPINSTRYALGDRIAVSVLDEDAAYTYSWVEGSNKKTGTEYIIPYATAEAYTIKLTMSLKNGGGCPKDTTITLTKDGSLCAPTLALSGTGKNKICTGGVCRLTAEVTNLCTDNSVLKYEWYRGEIKLAEQYANGSTEAYYTATEAGTYTVRLYTSYGMVSKEVTITTNTALAETLTIPASTMIGAGETAILSAQCNNVKAWTWTPEDQINGSNAAQYVTTKQLTEDTDFTVYAEQHNGCMSSGKTTVKIGDTGLEVVLEPARLALCKGGSGTLEAKVTGGTAPYSYTWPAKNLENSKDNIAKYKLDAFTTDPYTEYLTVTDAAGNSKNVAVQVTIASATEPKLELTGGDICEGNELTVGLKSGNVTNYTWYIRDNNAVDKAITIKPNQGATLQMDTRGDYTVWVAGNTSVCLSDTAKTKADVKVNGFDLAWDPKPLDYKLGGDIEAGVRIDNTTSSSCIFNWDALKNGRQTTAAGVNPSKYEVTAASESNYHFKVEASVRISDSKTCSKILEADVATKAGGLMLAVSDKTVTQCTNGAVRISATAEGGTGAYTFVWYKAGDAATELRKQVYPTGGEATDVFVHGGFSNGDKIVVQLTDASSPMLTRRDTIVVNTSAANAPLADAGADMTIQSGTATVLFGNVTGGTPLSWHWSPENKLATGENTQYPTTTTLTGQQDYTLYVVGDNHCVSLPDKVTVNVTTTDGFTVDIDDPGVLCVGNTTKLSASTTPVKTEIIWEWHETTGQLTDLNAEQPDFTASGTTTVFVKATAGGITASNSKKITVKSDLAPTLEIRGFLADKVAVCEGSELKVVATNVPAVDLGEATWYVDGDKQSGNALTFEAQLEDGVTSAIREIKVEAKSIAGCPAVGAKEETVTIYAQPELEWDASSSLVIAQGDPVQMTAKLKAGGTTPDYTYTWSHPHKVGTFGFTDEGRIASPSLSATSSVTGLADGARSEDVYCFQVYVTDGNTCRSLPLEQDVIVDGNALIVGLEPKYTGGYCKGGMAILQATVKAATQPTGLKYEWYKNDVLISAADAGYILNGNELVVKEPNTTDTYKVKVTADGDKAGQSTGVTLTENTTHSAVTLTGVDLLIPQGTHTALTAIAPVTIEHWQWSPKEMLASGEETLKNPYTINLNKQQIYTVYGVDENSCVTKPANVTVKVTSVAPPEDGNKELFAVIEPDTRTICVENKLQLNTRVWSNPGGATSYSWEPTDHLDMIPGADKPIFSVNQPGNYSYAVTVSRGELKAIARTDIKVVSGTLPELAIDLSKTGLACAGSEVVVKVQNGVAVDKYTWIVDGVVDPAVTGNTYSWPSVESPTNVKLQVIAETSGSCMSNVIALDSVVKPALKLDDLQVVDSCGQVILFSNAGKDQQYTWSLTAGDTQLQKTEGASADTLYLTQKTNFTTASVPYTVVVKVKPRNGGCESTGNKTGKVYFQPKVVLDKWTYEGEALSYTVREKGENVPVSIDNDHSNFGVGNSTLDWISYAGVALTTGPEQAIVYNVQKEDTIVAIVTNKEAPGCVSRDSMPVYLYPDAPEVDIDTNTNRNNIKLTWKSVPADSVRVWGIVDDAYNVLGNGYKRLASVKAVNKEWSEPNMGDRLKFYYLQSVRKIGNKSFASQIVSDTVGWLKQTLYGKNTFNPSLVAANVIAYPFDMSGKGIITDRDLVNKVISPALIHSGASIGYWNFTDQEWKNDDYVDMMGDGTWIEWMGDNEFDLTKGAVYRIVFSNSEIESADLLLYGKLDVWNYDFHINTNGKSSMNLVLNPLLMIDKRKRQALGNEIPAIAVGIWDLSLQEFANADYVDFGDGYFVWLPDEESDSILLLPLQPVTIVVEEEKLDWKK